MNTELKNKLEFSVFRLFVFLLNLPGYYLAHYAARPLAILFYYIIPVRKKTVIKNLKIAFPGYDERRIRKISFNSYLSFATTLIEIMTYRSLSPEKLKQYFRCSRLDLIEKRFKENRGLILLTAHFGNWEYGAAFVSQMIGIPMYVVMKPQRNGYVTGWLSRMRSKFGNREVALGLSIREVYRELKNKNMIGIVGDQRGPKEAQRVRFFGRDTAMYTGPAALALKTGAPVIAAIVIRRKDFTYDIELEEIRTDDLTGSEEEKITAVTQKYMSILEHYVSLYPEQWLWMHDRWKY